jgi:hypothetical protein
VPLIEVQLIGYFVEELYSAIPSSYAAALSTSVDPGYNDLDEQIPGNDGKSKEERKEYFRHRLRRQSNGNAGMKELQRLGKAPEKSRWREPRCLRSSGDR